MDRPKNLIHLAGHHPNHTLYCIHPVGGQVTFYKAIAQEVKNECTVFGIEADKPSETTLNVTVQTLARKYVDLLKHHGNQNPISLLGWSMGGLIAFEMAHQLEKSDIKVNHLILIDTYTPQCMPNLSTMDDDEFFYHLLRMLNAGRKYVDSQTIPWSSKLLLWLLTTLNIPSGWLKFFLRLFGLKNIDKDLVLLKKNMMDPSRSLDPLPDWIEFAKHKKLIQNNLYDDLIITSFKQIRQQIHAYQEYKPSKINRPIAYIKAKINYKNKANKTDWSEYCNFVKTFVIPATHYDIIEKADTRQVIKKEIMAQPHGR